MRSLLSLALLIPLAAPLLAGDDAAKAPACDKTQACEACCPDIGHADLAKDVAAKQVVLIDCNGTESFAQGHIPGAIDFQAHGNDLAKLLPADKAALVVAYCGGPKCGAWKEGASAAMKLGYTNIHHYRDGISGWKKSGADLAK